MSTPCAKHSTFGLRVREESLLLRYCGIIEYELTLLGMQPRLGDKLLGLLTAFPQNATAGLKGLSSEAKMMVNKRGKKREGIEVFGRLSIRYSREYQPRAHYIFRSRFGRLSARF